MFEAFLNIVRLSDDITCVIFTVSDVSESSAPMVSCLQPEDLQQSQQDPNDHISLGPGEGQTPCSVNQEMKIFPYLFPDGVNGFNETRNTKLGLGRYFNSRLFSKDNRFASDPQYIFFAQYLQELNNINSAISIAMRKSSKKTVDTNNVTAGMITDSSQRDKLLNSDKGYRYLKAIRGSPTYWQKVLRDLFAMLKQLGIPTWFCSFSAADRRWPEILEAICVQQGLPIPENPDWTEYCEIINANPVTACRMFESRVLSFISTVILSPAKPIGEVIDFFYRTEFQSRGWPHIHCLFWCKEAPKFDSSTDNKEFISYIDKYITCAISNQEQEPDFYEIVSSVQLHSKSHSRSCKKGGKTCRFNFPRPIANETFIATPASPPEDICPILFKKNATNLLTSVWDAMSSPDCTYKSVEEVFEQLNVTHEQYEKAHCALAQRNTIIFKRTVPDVWVNPYNKHILEAWNGNMDIQPVLDAESCLMYMVKYILKAERELGDVLRKAQQEAEEGHMEPLKQLRKLGNVYLNAREICVMEAVYRVCGMNLKSSSRETFFVPASQNSARITKPISALKQQDTSSEDVWMTSIIDRYIARPETEEFEHICLAEFASKYKVTQKSVNKFSETEDTESPTTNVYTLLDNKGTIKRRKTQAVIRYPDCNRQKKSEDYYYTMLAMFYPCRQQDFKPEDVDTYEQMFHQFSDIIIPNMQPYEQLSEELSDAWQAIQNGVIPEDAWAEIAANQEVQRLEEEEELNSIRAEILEDMEEINIPDICQEEVKVPKNAPACHTSSTRTSQSDHCQMVRSLNEEQRKLYMFIKHWAEQKEQENAKPFHIFLTGGAGTGKSHTIKCIINEVDRIMSRKSENADMPVVIQVAYIGTAAFNIDGQTIHSAFNISKFSGDFLSEDAANTLRSKLHDLQLLIIDEVSMVSTKLLNTIHCRLQQIKRPSQPNSVFGNISVLAVGDFYQIPPISGKSLVSVNKSLTDLWCLFSIWTLHEVVRQRGDDKFTEMLNRIRTQPQNQQLKQEDMEFLRSRLVSEISPDFPRHILHIAPLRRQRDAHNAEMLKLISEKQTLYEIEAVDICHDKKTQKTYRRNDPLKVEDATIPAHFSVCVGTRIMLTMNLDVSDGLTNGAIGTVSAIIPGHMPLGQPAAICVVFDNEKVGIKSRSKNKPPPHVDQRSTVITPVTEVIQSSPYEVTRHGYPFILAWSVTMHKVQGITTDKALVSLKGIFKPGMAYVALSRVTSGKGLYLLDSDFDLNVIYSNPNVKKQLDSMPKADSLPEWKILFKADEITVDPETLILASHNCEGYLPHLQDIKQNNFLQRADIIALQETWTSSGMTLTSLSERHVPVFKHRD